jgi:hypothetical protein
MPLPDYDLQRACKIHQIGMLCCAEVPNVEAFALDFVDLHTASVSPGGGTNA